MPEIRKWCSNRERKKGPFVISNNNLHWTKIDDVVNYQSCWIEKMCRQHGLWEFWVSGQNMEHLGEKQQFSVHLVLMFWKSSSSKTGLQTFLKHVSNHPMMKANHDEKKKMGVFELFVEVGCPLLGSFSWKTQCVKEFHIGVYSSWMSVLLDDNSGRCRTVEVYCAG